MSEEITTEPSAGALPPPVEPQLIGYALPTTPTGGEAGSDEGISRIDAATITARLAGVYYLIAGAKNVIFILTHMMRKNPFLNLAGSSAFAISFAEILPGLVLVLWAKRIALWLLPNPGGSPSATARFAGMTGIELQSTAYAIVGVVLMVGSGRSLLVLALDRESRGYNPDPWEAAIEMAFGLGLFLGGKQIASLWSRIHGKYQDEKLSASEDRTCAADVGRPE